MKLCAKPLGSHSIAHFTITWTGGPACLSAGGTSRWHRRPCRLGAHRTLLTIATGGSDTGTLSLLRIDTRSPSNSSFVTIIAIESIDRQAAMQMRTNCDRRDLSSVEDNPVCHPSLKLLRQSNRLMLDSTSASTESALTLEVWCLGIFQVWICNSWTASARR